MDRTPHTHWHTNSRAERVRFLIWKGKGSKALLIHHGLGGHAGRYQVFADALPNVTVCAYDARGHGESDGVRGQVNGLQQLASDLNDNLPVMLEQAGASRALLWGHSMGAATVAQYLLDYQPHAAIEHIGLCAPPVALDLNRVARIKIRIGRLLTRLAPGLTLDNELDANGVSSLPDEVKRYQRDPLVHSRISLALGTSLVDEAPSIVDRAAQISLPTLLVHGTDDPISAIRGTRAMADAMPNAIFESFEGCRHEIHHDAQRHRDALFKAIDARLAD